MNFWQDPEEPCVTVNVIAGGHIFTDIPRFKSLIDSVSITKGREPGEVETLTVVGCKYFKFSRVSWNKSGERSLVKTAGGALAGTLLAGPFGAIAGGLIGAKKKDTSTAYLYLIDDNWIEHEVHIRCNMAEYQAISRIPFMV